MFLFDQYSAWSHLSCTVSTGSAFHRFGRGGSMGGDRVQINVLPSLIAGSKFGPPVGECSATTTSVDPILLSAVQKSSSASYQTQSSAIWGKPGSSSHLQHQKREATKHVRCCETPRPQTSNVLRVFTVWFNQVQDG